MIGAPGPRLVEHSGCIKTYPAQWKKDTVDIAELARKRFIDKWSYRKLARYFKRSEDAIGWQIKKLRNYRFNIEGISNELRLKLIASDKQSRKR